MCAVLLGSRVGADEVGQSNAYEDGVRGALAMMGGCVGSGGGGCAG